jgi:cytochrome c oxidase subunit 3
MGLFSILGTKPWQQSGQVEHVQGGSVLEMPSTRIGLWFFMAVVASLFGLFSTAYHMRAEYADWRQVDVPSLLYFNTLVLILASVCYQVAWSAMKRGKLSLVRNGLSLAGACTVGFLGLQAVAWQQMLAAGNNLWTGPAWAFFYLLTGVHALHLIGGMFVWVKATRDAWQTNEGDDVEQVGRLRLRVELCTVYWHFLLWVWGGLLALMLTT